MVNYSENRKNFNRLAKTLSRKKNDGRFLKILIFLCTQSRSKRKIIFSAKNGYLYVNDGYFNPPFELSKIIKSYFNVVE